MLKALKIALIAGCAVAGFGMNALAADADLPIFVEQAPELLPVEVGNGWYIRGDIGTSFAGKHESNEYTAGNVRYTNNISDALNVGIGFGYQLNDYFRADVGVEQLFDSNFSATTLIGPRGPCIGWGTFAGPPSYIDTDTITNCLDVDSAKYNAMNFMANAYIDLGTYIGFTPYIGAGIGTARVKWSEETDATTCIPRAAATRAEGCSAQGTPNQPLPNTIYTEKGVTNDGIDYRMSYALMAGVAYKASQNVTWDLSYRMLNVGANNITYSLNTGSGMARDGFGTQQVRLGVRYALW